MGRYAIRAGVAIIVAIVMVLIEVVSPPFGSIGDRRIFFGVLGWQLTFAYFVLFIISDLPRRQLFQQQRYRLFEQEVRRRGLLTFPEWWTANNETFGHLPRQDATRLWVLYLEEHGMEITPPSS